MSHRALIFGALAEGQTKISGLLEGDDVLRTAEAMRAFGAQVTRMDDGNWHIEGCGARGWQSPADDIDFGNSGTGARLIMGAAAGFDLTVRYTGDASLSSRPMGRVLKPLREMGAKFECLQDTLPITQSKGGGLSPIRHTPAHASAQIKSAILLAGLSTTGSTEIIETRLTRDHSENMLAAFGVNVTRKPIKPARNIEGIESNGGGGQNVSITGPATLKAANITIPGDPSSCAFLIVSALIVPGSDIVIKNVMMNPSRTGLFEVLTEMGAFLRTDNFRRSGGETIADLHVRHSKLNGVNVPAARVPSMIDEYPVLAVLAAFARGTTIMRGLAELRVKESDRLASSYDLLKINGVSAEIKDDSLIVHGTPSHIEGGGLVKTHHDHRLAMSALVLGLGTKNPVSIDDDAMIATSFPTFFDLMDGLGASITRS